MVCRCTHVRNQPTTDSCAAIVGILIDFQIGVIPGNNHFIGINKWSVPVSAPSNIGGVKWNSLILSKLLKVDSAKR
jgi:hypothetical protein